MTTSGAATSNPPDEAGHEPPTFDALYRREWMPMVRLAYLLTGSEAVAQEVVQDAFIELRHRWSTVANTGGYLRTSVVNRSRTAWRKESREADPTAHRAAHADAATVQPPELDDMWRRVCRLPAGQREAVVLRFYEDLSVAQIAAVLGCSEGTVKSRLSRALDNLKGIR